MIKYREVFNWTEVSFEDKILERRLFVYRGTEDQS